MLAIHGLGFCPSARTRTRQGRWVATAPFKAVSLTATRHSCFSGTFHLRPEEVRTISYSGRTGAPAAPHSRDFYKRMAYAFAYGAF
jgi:hypothetical protein